MDAYLFSDDLKRRGVCRQWLTGFYRHHYASRRAAVFGDVANFDLDDGAKFFTGLSHHDDFFHSHYRGVRHFASSDRFATNSVESSASGFGFVFNLFHHGTSI